MRPAPDAPFLLGLPLAACLRAVRSHRRLGQQQVAKAIGISRRSYIALEGGSGRLSLDQLVAFADATASDRLALFAAVLFDKPSLAVHSADNKLMTVLMIAAEQFDAVMGDRLAAVRPQEGLSAFKAAFAALQTELEQRQAAEQALQTPLAPRPGDDAV